MKNWADSKHSVNSGNSHEDNPEPSHRKRREGAETKHGATLHICSICKYPKLKKDFYKKDKKTGRRDSTCKSCRIALNRERVLGITNDDYWKMYKEQKGRCGICKRRMYSKRYKVFCVDHNHTTGEIRGLLCHNCNRALGMFRDDPIALKRAIGWVEDIVRSSE